MASGHLRSGHRPKTRLGKAMSPKQKLYAKLRAAGVNGSISIYATPTTFLVQNIETKELPFDHFDGKYVKLVDQG